MEHHGKTFVRCQITLKEEGWWLPTETESRTRRRKIERSPRAPWARGSSSRGVVLFKLLFKFRDPVVGKQVTCTLGVLVDFPVERVCRIAAVPKLKNAGAARVLCEEGVQLVDNALDDDELLAFSALRALLDSLPVHDWQVVEGDPPVDGSLGFVELLLTDLDFCLFNLVCVEAY